jgi:predicted nucleic acid-binding protein
MKYVLDTNVLIHAVRNSPTWQFIDEIFAPFDFENQTFICFVSVAEILSIAKQLGWQYQKLQGLALLFSQLEIITVSGQPDDAMIASYVEIDAYSQGKHQDLELPDGLSARNMGKMIFG